MTAKSFLQASAAMAVLAVGGCLCALILSVRADVVAAPAMAANAQNSLLARVDRLQATVEALPAQVVHPVLAGAQAEIRHGVDALGDRLQEVTGKDGRLDQAITAANSRLADGIGAANSRLGELTATAAGLRNDLKPVLDHSSALVKDAQDSWDDLYPDVRGTVASATVAVTSVAQASEEVRSAAPEVRKAATGILNSADGIAVDVKREVDAATAPKKWWQKALGPLYTVGRLAAAFM